jgi:hypothetical protein
MYVVILRRHGCKCALIASTNSVQSFARKLVRLDALDVTAALLAKKIVKAQFLCADPTNSD